MRILLTLTLLLCLQSSIQATVIREQFAQAVDYVGWQIMDAYMQDYLNIRPNQTAERAGYEAFQQEFSQANYNIEQPPNSEAVATFLEDNDWRNASTNLYRRIISIKEMYRNEWTEDEAIDFLQQQIRNISLQSLRVANEDDYNELKQVKALLIQEVKQYLTSESPAPTTEESEPEQQTVTEQAPSFMSPPTSVVDQTSEIVSENLAFLDSPYYKLAVLVFIVLLLGLLWYTLRLLRKQDARIDRHTKRIEELTARQFQKTTPYVTREEVAQLKNRVKEAEAQVASLRKHLPQKKEAVKPRFGPNNPPAPVIKSYYLSTPNSDGTFPTGSMSAQFRPSASVYHFEVLEQNGENTATFTVANNADAMKDALSSPGSYLEPVCESENSYFPGAQRIVNVEPGKATREGDQWVVTPEDKALIRYE
ncbi:hypothetical protein [Tunicatimonas pelagia]|uniref:hypothetical protein n=1 Tax=Tunicatimonas pelagia TaxID=931531 RepID=UPI002665DBC9|nr:hypothetical protein [Tunicatimonas pelagia]WKN46064.1 hypothetical protein P0M28_14000 [Tunicatimonas pelagia]